MFAWTNEDIIKEIFVKLSCILIPGPSRSTVRDGRQYVI